MQKIVKGKRYDYEILGTRFNKNCHLFTVKAIHKPTRRISFITNLNIILSELGISSDESRFWNSEWIITKKETTKFSRIAEQLFCDKKYLPYLENYLDTDRKESEWENYE